jgi:hypothetical protein
MTRRSGAQSLLERHRTPRGVLSSTAASVGSPGQPQRAQLLDHSDSGKNSAALSASPRQASEMISRRLSDSQTALLDMLEECAPARLVLLGPLADAQRVTFSGDRRERRGLSGDSRQPADRRRASLFYLDGIVLKRTSPAQLPVGRPSPYMYVAAALPALQIHRARYLVGNIQIHTAHATQL